MNVAPDFDALRKERDEAIARVVKEAARSMWGDEAADKVVAHVSYGGGTQTCYCGCPEGPCEHSWGGWKNIEDDDGNVCGGTTVCEKCGMSAISHDMRVGP